MDDEEEYTLPIPENSTSLHAYRQREAQLQKIISEDMPQNRRDIQEAKEFGDLSENFEYESARNRERQLITRMEQLRKELEEMKIFDFASLAPASVAGPGTCVTLRYPTGTISKLSILGAWDFDEALGIISFRGRLAEALLGAQAGDIVYLPDPDFDDEELEAELLSVDPLPPEVLEWAAN